MGLNGIISTDIPRSRVNWMEVARSCDNLVPFDMANLMFTCAYASAAHAVHGDYTHALAKLKRYLLFYQQEKLCLFYVLDGRTNGFKANEDLRRKQNRQEALAEIEAHRENGGEPSLQLYQKCLSNTSRYIGLVARLLKSMNLPFIVAPGEADGQLAACAKDGVVISRDNDMLALGVARKVSILNGGWMSGEAEMLSLADCPPSNSYHDHSVSSSTKTVSNSTEIEKLAPLRDVYRRHGVDGLVYFAATCGCDFTPMKSGIPGIGPKTIAQFLASYEGVLTPRRFAELLTNESVLVNKITSEFRSDIVMSDDPDLLYKEYILPVTDAFAGAFYYTSDFRVMTLQSKEIIDGMSFCVDTNCRHSLGELDPKSGDKYTPEDQVVLESFSFQTLGKSMFCESHENVSSCLIPEDFESFGIPQLRGIIGARGGTVTHNKSELLHIVRAMKELEEEYEPIVIDTSGGLMLPTLSFKSTLKPALEIDKILSTKEIHLEKNRWARETLAVAQECYQKNIVVEDPESVSESSAFCDRKLLKFYFSDVGTVGSDNKKCLRDSYSKHIEQVSVANAPQRYHGYAIIAEDRHMLITTQSASLGKDESSRSTKERGQKPDPKQYISILEFRVEPTSIEKGDSHAYGKIVDITKAYCCCKAGASKCVHDGMAIRDQIRMWGPLPVDESICTDTANSWKHRGADKLRVFNPMKPIRELGFEKLVEGKTKQYRACQEVSYEDYNVLSMEDNTRLCELVTPTIFFPFYDAVQNARKDKRPCRAALLYRGDDVKDVEPGLIDIRKQVHLWGTRSEIAEANKENAGVN